MPRPLGVRYARHIFISSLWGGGLLWMAWLSAPEAISTLRFGTVGLLPLPTRLTLGCCGGAILLSSWGYVDRSSRKPLKAASLGINVLLTVLAVLVWPSTGRHLEVLGLVTQSIRLATPIALGAFGGLLCERSGVLNIDLEGMMLSAACCGFMAALLSQSVWIGIIAAMLSGALMAALHAVLTLYRRAAQILSGMALNMLAIGGTGFLRHAVLLHHTAQAPEVLASWPLPLLADILIVGGMLFRHQPLVLYHGFAGDHAACAAVVHALGFTDTCPGRQPTGCRHPGH